MKRQLPIPSYQRSYALCDPSEFYRPRALLLQPTERWKNTSLSHRLIDAAVLGGRCLALTPRWVPTSQALMLLNSVWMIGKNSPALALSSWTTGVCFQILAEIDRQAKEFLDPFRCPTNNDSAVTGGGPAPPRGCCRRQNSSPVKPAPPLALCLTGAALPTSAGQPV